MYLWRMQRRYYSDDEDTPEKCKERRRKRIQMRRIGSASPNGSTPPTSNNSAGNMKTGSSSGVDDGKRIRKEEAEGLPVKKASNSSRGDKADAPVGIVAIQAPPVAVEPLFGSMSVAGRSRDMEDAIAVRTNLCWPEINRRQPVHYFAVFDGHGGRQVAELCRERMHVFVWEELMRVKRTVKVESGRNVLYVKERGFETRQAQGMGVGLRGEEEWKDCWSGVIQRSFQRMDDMAMELCSCGAIGYQCGCHPADISFGGTTAVVALLTPEYIVVANCGDSRAVLCRGGKAVSLSVDHKPDRPDEHARITAAGGRVIYLNGARVEGILAMSRAIGDRYLKPMVISEPEITFLKRQPEDECLILASDGLWDVLSSDMACEIASGCLRDVNAPKVATNGGPPVEDGGAGALRPPGSTVAAALLTRLALGRQSADNISVIVVDLMNS